MYKVAVMPGDGIGPEITDAAMEVIEVAGVDNYELAEWIMGNLDFDQLILECYTGGNSGWVHCSYVENGRKEMLTYDKLNGYRHGLING